MIWLMVPSLKTALHLFMLMIYSCTRIFLTQGITPPAVWHKLSCSLDKRALPLTQSPSKCKCMIVSRLRQHSVNLPTLLRNGVPMEKVNSYKYLGVTLTSDLTRLHHIRNITTKSSRLVGLLYRQFFKWSCPATLSRLYISLVRPHLTRCSCLESLSCKGHQLSWVCAEVCIGLP